MLVTLPTIFYINSGWRVLGIIFFTGKFSVRYATENTICLKNIFVYSCKMFDNVLQYY